MLFSQTAVTQSGREWSRDDKVRKGFTSHWDEKTPSVNNIDAMPPSLSEGSYHTAVEIETFQTGANYTC